MYHFEKVWMGGMAYQANQGLMEFQVGFKKIRRLENSIKKRLMNVNSILIGRAGADGIPGKDGRDGVPGANGKNGVDGNHGKRINFIHLLIMLRVEFHSKGNNRLLFES